MSHATESYYAESCNADACYAEACAMSQPLTVFHRGGQLAYPSWAAHTTTSRDHPWHGAARVSGRRTRAYVV
jgi:hypothetical protein